MTSKHVFISYARKNKAYVTDLKLFFDSAGINYWIDEHIESGTNWEETIREALRNAYAVVLIASPDAGLSDYVHGELTLADKYGCPVYPIWVEGDDWTSCVPLRHLKTQYEDARHGNLENAASKLVKLLQQIRDNPVDMLATDQLIPEDSNADEQLGNEESTKRDSDEKRTDSNRNKSTGKISDGNSWNLPVILGLMLAFISAVAAIIPILPNEFSLLPSPMTPFPQSDFSVAVAGFAYENLEGDIEQHPLADEMSDIVESELSQITEIDNIAGWRSRTVGRIIGNTSEDREQIAAQIAQRLNVDIVIYGLVRDEGVHTIFIPEFYIAADFVTLELEITGSDTLGSPLEFIAESEDEIMAIDSFRQRLFVLRSFLRGLAFYFAGDFEEAQQSFEESLDNEVEGLEILYVLAGNAAIREPNPEQALIYYNTALSSRPEYARALVGRGIALYQLALHQAEENSLPYENGQLLDPKQTCADIQVESPGSPRLLAELALRCYREARLSSDTSVAADIDVKVAFGIGQTSLWLSTNTYADYWDDVQEELSRVIDLYEASDLERQSRLHATAGQSHAWLGLRLLSLSGDDPASVCDAMNHYQRAVVLLQLDANRDYNTTWIETYSGQANALETWLTDQDFTCTTSE